MKCPHCEKEFTSKFCPDCGYNPDVVSHSEHVQTPKEIIFDEVKESIKAHSQKSMLRVITDSFLTVIILFIIIMFFVSKCQGENDKNDKHLTRGDWSGLSNYMFAVEIDDFDGDIYEAGKYHFGIVGAATKPEDTMVVWDIYVSDNCYKNQSELKEYELKATIGGGTKIEADIDLYEGEYVYVNYNDVWGNPCGYVTIEKQ